MNLSQMHSAHVAEVNARHAAAGRCLFMHKPDEVVRAAYLMTLPIGNVIPLCTPCRDWWLLDAEDHGDPMARPVSILPYAEAPS